MHTYVQLGPPSGLHDEFDEYYQTGCGLSFHSEKESPEWRDIRSVDGVEVSCIACLARDIRRGVVLRNTHDV